MTIPFILRPTGLRAFHGDAAIKAKYLARVDAHREADEIVQGVYTEYYGAKEEKLRGCAVGCTIHGSDHAAYERELGIPRWIARLEDRLFEGMPIEKAKLWPGRFLQAIPVGADLSGIYPPFVVWLLTDATSGVLRFIKDPELRSLTQQVADHYQNGTMTREIGRTLADAIWRRRVGLHSWDRYYELADERDRRRREARRLRAEADRLKAAGSPAAAAEEAAEAAAAAEEAAEAAAAAEEAGAAEAGGEAWFLGRERFALGASERLLVVLADAPVPVAA